MAGQQESEGVCLKMNAKFGKIVQCARAVCYSRGIIVCSLAMHSLGVSQPLSDFTLSLIERTRRFGRSAPLCRQRPPWRRRPPAA